MQSARICLYLPSLDGGGAERVFVDLANEFCALGLRVDLALASARGPYLGEIAAGIRIVDFRSSGVLASLPKLVGYLRSERPDALLSGLDHANLAAILARLISGTRARCVVSARSVPTVVYREDKSFSGWVTLQLMKLAYQFSDGIIANGQGVAEDLSQFLLRSAGKLHVIYNPVNIASIETLSRAAIEHPWFAAPRPPIIVSVGSLTVLKDFETLIRAFGIVRSKRDCRLVILGEGPERPKLESTIYELGLQNDVDLRGFVSNPFPWMRRAKVFVSSSLTEGCPNSLMQALACGTSVVSTDCPGGSAEILERGRWGRLVPVGDAAAMAQAMLGNLDSEVHADVRTRAKDFMLNRIAREYLRVLLPRQLTSTLDT